MKTTMPTVQSDVAALGREVELLARILKVAQFQHRRAIYYQRLRASHVKLNAAVRCCAASSLASTGGAAAACKALEAALHCIPASHAYLRHSFLQTYFMPLALTCLALLSRCALLAVNIHTALQKENGLQSARGNERPVLLSLARPAITSSELLSGVFAPARATPTQQVDCLPSSQALEELEEAEVLPTEPSAGAHPIVQDDDGEDMGEPMIDEQPIPEAPKIELEPEYLPKRRNAPLPKAFRGTERLLARGSLLHEHIARVRAASRVRAKRNHRESSIR